ncbi:hypothetical protein BRC81_10375 [Halobacteriales archaeon QS_1_68_20]|nr:MAG: hypothetical protein BRC81_10375 [Halobacteriales archaeon QS_1_68_20]
MQSTSDARASDLRAELERADDAVERAQAKVKEYGEDTIREVADAHDEFTKLLARYRERATGTGDFRAYVEFEREVSEFVDGLSEDLPERDAFEAAEDALDQRRLSESDFERAHDLLDPVEDLIDRLDERREALDRYRAARRRVADRRRELDERVTDLRRVRELGQADLDAPLERLRNPVEAYDGAVSKAFETFKREASASEVLDVVAATAWYPLVEYRQPPEDLRAYVADNEAGTEPIPKLLEYANYSRSKLSHYVEDATSLKRAVATQQTYLERLDADPLTVGWPPPSAEALRFRTSEYESVVRRFAGEDVLETLRTVRRLPAKLDYERLQDAAVAHEELSRSERDMVARGEVEAELSTVRERRDELAAALEEHPDR